MAINLDDLTPDALKELDADEIITTIKETAKQAKELAEEKEKLLKKRDQLIADNKKYKTINRVASEQLGVDLRDPESEAKIVDLLSKVKPAEELVDDFTEESTDDLKPLKKQEKLSDSQLEHQRAMQRLQSEMKALRDKLATAEQEKADQEKKNKEITLKNIVMKEMVAAGCDTPEHLWKLTKEKYRLDETDPTSPTAVGGDEYDPVPVGTILGNLKADAEYKRYFMGSGSTGSGMTQNASTPTSMANPFRTDFQNPDGTKAANMTKAAEVMQKNPDLGKRLLNEAAAAGKLDSVLARAFSSR